jgi:hypothetical protein
MDIGAANDLVHEDNAVMLGDATIAVPARMSRHSLARPKRRLMPFLTLVALAVSLPAFEAAAQAQPTFDDGRRAYDFGDYTTAEKIWSVLAQSGDARSQSSLGYLYREGQAVRQNVPLAAAWYYRAAVQGEPTAQSALCGMLFKGDGVRRDLKAALFWCELSIEGGERGGTALRERVLNRMSVKERDEAWQMIAQWHAVQEHGTCCAPAAEPAAADTTRSERSLSSLQK